MNHWETAFFVAGMLICCYLVAEILAWWAQFY
jgi:hypothetical protein